MKFVFSLIILCYFVSLSQAQVDIKQLKGSWFIQDVKQAKTSKINFSQEDLQSDLESMKDCYLHFTENTMEYVWFEDPYESVVEYALSYTFNSAKSRLVLTEAGETTPLSQVIVLKTLSATKLVFEMFIEGDDGYVAEYHFRRAAPKELILGFWSLESVSIQDYINSLPESEKEVAQMIEDELYFSFMDVLMGFSADGFCYAELPTGDGDYEPIESTWSMEGGNLILVYSDGAKDTMRIQVLNHNMLQLVIPNADFDMTLIMTRS